MAPKRMNFNNRVFLCDSARSDSSRWQHCWLDFLVAHQERTGNHLCPNHVAGMCQRDLNPRKLRFPTLGFYCKPRSGTLFKTHTHRELFLSQIKGCGLKRTKPYAWRRPDVQKHMYFLVTRGANLTIYMVFVRAYMWGTYRRRTQLVYLGIGVCCSYLQEVMCGGDKRTVLCLSRVVMRVSQSPKGTLSVIPRV